MNLIDSASLVVTPNAYKTSKLYSIVPSDGTGDLTFSRTGDTATRINSAGLIETVLANKPRLDYLGSTCPRLLLEPQRTNLGLYSEDFTQSTWTTNAIQTTVTGNATIAPDGNTTADAIYTTTVNDSHYVQQRTGSATSGTTYTISCFVKKLGYDYCRISTSNTGTCIGTFRFSTKTLTISGINVVANSGRVDELSNGWFRISVSVLAPASATWRWNIFILNDSGQDVFTGDITKGLYAWGFQMEVGSYATSYIATTTASVTRNQELNSRTSASALIGSTEGTIFTDLIIKNFDSFGTLLNLSNGTSNEYVQIIVNNSREIKGEVKSTTNGGVQATIILSNNTAGNRYKVAFAYKQNDFIMYVNGVQIGTDTSGLLPVSLSRIDYDINNYSFGSSANLAINSSAIWKTRLSNTDLATLTTI